MALVAVAVGNDWQAIYRFAGSDIAVMREFGERFGDYERTGPPCRSVSLTTKASHYYMPCLHCVR